MSAEQQNQLAVALHYDRTGAPRVVAKGKGTIGAKIIEVAKAHDIPIEENEVLAGALSNVETRRRNSGRTLQGGRRGADLRAAAVEAGALNFRCKDFIVIVSPRCQSASSSQSL